MKSEDQRVVRTRKQLRDSFIKLVNKRGFDDVSIRDVTRHAGVGYRTFFRHYRDTRELFEDALADFIAELRQVLLPPDTLDMTERNVITMFHFSEKNVDLFRALYRAPFFEESSKLFIDFGKKVGRHTFAPSHIPAEIVETHFLYSMMNLQRWWLENGMPIPADEMGRYAHDLIVRPIISLSTHSLSEYRITDKS
ncbi:MAG: TetR/AcrR family transcriptional regulator [Ardenticatenaceae bacterium]|nr:TetR/AcrR family transcriptional regulator [Ardenticatenaceae bacterium]